jgi:hypothetical protein
MDGVLLVPHGWLGEGNRNNLTGCRCSEPIMGYPPRKGSSRGSYAFQDSAKGVLVRYHGGISLMLTQTSFNPDDFHMSINPIRWEINPATRPARLHLLLDHLFSVDLELYLTTRPGLGWSLIFFTLP